MMEDLKNNHKIITVIGILIIFLIIWIRFIRTLGSKSVFELSTTLLGKYLILCSISFFTILMVFSILQIKPLKINKISDSSIFRNRLLLFLVNIYTTYIKNSTKFVYKTYIFEYINIAVLIEKPLYNFILLFAGKKKYIIYLLTNSFPKLIILLFFLLDVFYYQYFHFFFKSLTLLVIPLCVNIYRYMAEDLADLNVYFFQSHLDFVIMKDSDKMLVLFKKEIPNIEGAFDIVTKRNDTALLKWFAYNYDVYSNIKSFCLKINSVEEKIKPYENLFIYICYLVGWLYILFLSII